MTGVLVAIGGTVQPEAVGGRGRLAPGVHAELGEDVAHVDAGGLAADVERLGDLAVRPAGGHQAQDLALPGREPGGAVAWDRAQADVQPPAARERLDLGPRSEEHTSELQSRGHLVCRLLLEKKKKSAYQT